MSITTHLSNKESKINETDRVKSYIYSIDQSNRNETKQIWKRNNDKGEKENPKTRKNYKNIYINGANMRGGWMRASEL